MSEILPTRLSPLPEHLGPLPCHLGPLPGCLGPPQDTRLPSLFWGSKPRGLGIPLTLDRGMGGGALADPLCAPSVTVVALERQQHVAQENLVPEHFYVEQSEGWDGGTWGDTQGWGWGRMGTAMGGDRVGGDLDGGTGMGTWMEGLWEQPGLGMGVNREVGAWGQGELEIGDTGGWPQRGHTGMGVCMEGTWGQTGLGTGRYRDMDGG